MNIDGTENAQGGMEGQDQSLMDTILGTSGETLDTTGKDQGASGQQATGSQSAYTFAGKQWKGGQSEAEKWANKLYGELSQNKGTLKELKALFESDPESLQAASQDPKWAAILGKLGLEVAREETEEQDAQEGEQGEQGYQSLRDEIRLERAHMALEREESQFERKLKRPLTDDEHNSVMRVLQRASSLSYEEAFNLAYHKRMMDEAAKRAGQQVRPGNGRPKPPPMHVPGLKTEGNGKKPADMSHGEFREYLKDTQEFKDMLSRG